MLNTIDFQDIIVASQGENRANLTELINKQKTYYSNAVTYYQNKENAFFDMWVQRQMAKNDGMIQDRMKEIIEKINESWNELVKALKPQIQLDKGKINLGNQNTTTKTVTINTNTDNKKSWTFNLSNNQEFQSMLGTAYENYFNQEFNAYLQKHTKMLISLLTSDKRDSKAITNVGQVRTKGTASISDIIIGDVSLAEKSTFDIGYSLETGNALNKEEEKSFFGFNLKGGYKNINTSHSFTSSIAIAQGLANLYRNSWASLAEQHQPRSWNRQYVEATADTYLAAYLKEILGPQNVFILFSSGYSLMSQYIESHRWYINLYYAETGDKDEVLEIAPAYEGRIYMTKKKDTQITTYSLLKLAQENNYLSSKQLKKLFNTDITITYHGINTT